MINQYKGLKRYTIYKDNVPVATCDYPSTADQTITLLSILYPTHTWTYTCRDLTPEELKAIDDAAIAKALAQAAKRPKKPIPPPPMPRPESDDERTRREYIEECKRRGIKFPGEE